MRLPVLLAFFFTALPALAQPVQVPIGNAGFEETISPDDPRPAEWWPTNKDSPLTTDHGVFFDGGRSLRIEYLPPFVGSMQEIDARPWRGRMLVLRARLKGAGIGEGNVGLWLRGNDQTGKVTGFVTSYGDLLGTDAGWQPREVRLVVDEATERLAFGAALGVTGTLWVDAVELRALDASETPLPSPAAQAYLDTAMSLVEENAYFSNRLEWAELRPRLLATAAGAAAPADTHAAISFLLRALGDSHSHFVSPEASERIASPQGDDPTLGISAKQLGRVGYLRVPGFTSTNPVRGKAFTHALRSHLEAQAKAGTCGWIIDLRDNTGGNMYPMIRGLSGVLGADTLGYFVGKASRQPWTGNDDHGIHALPGGQDTPIAVLQGPRTASSGEATLLSFVGRANTRSFGEPSRGLSTANRAFPMADGANLVLTTALMADRSGKVHGGRIPPDEAVQGSEATELAARAWLQAQPACTK